MESKNDQEVETFRILPLDESIIIFTLSTVLVCYFLVDEPQYEVEQSHYQIVEAINGLFIGLNLLPSLDTVINPDYLAHGIVRYKKYLSNLGWTFNLSKSSSMRPKGIGYETNELSKGFFVKIGAPDPFPVLMNKQFVWNLYHRQNKILEQANILMKVKYKNENVELPGVSLSSLFEPEKVYDLLYSLSDLRKKEKAYAMILAQNPSLKKEKSKKNNNEEEPNPVAIVSTLSNPRTLKSESSSYNKYLRDNRFGSSNFYINQHIISIEERVKLVKDHMPLLMNSVFHNQVSVNFLEKMKRNENKLIKISKKKEDLSLTLVTGESDVNREAEKIRVQSLRLLCSSITFIELIAAAQSGGSLLTPMLVISGMILYFGNVSRRAMNILSFQNLCCSYKTAKQIADGLIDQKDKEFDNMVTNTLANKKTKCFIAISDNYCTQQFMKNKFSEVPFTHTCATVSNLVLSVNENPDYAYLNKFSSKHFWAFLKYMGKTGFTNKKKKDLMIIVLKTYSREEFNKFIVSNNLIDTNAALQKYESLRLAEITIRQEKAASEREEIQFVQQEDHVRAQKEKETADEEEIITG